MTDLGYPYGDSTKVGRRMSELQHRSPNLIYLRFSDKQANGFFISRTNLLAMADWSFLRETKTIYNNIL